MAQEQQSTGVEEQATKPEAQSTTQQEAQASESEGETEKKTSLERGATRATPIERPERYGLGRPEIWSSPFSFVQKMMDEMDRMFALFGGGGPAATAPSNVFAPARGEGVWSPAIETFERDGHLVLRAELPGLEQNDVKVEVEGDELVISGERKHVERKTTEGRYYSERRYGSFERRMTLPVGCNADSIDASFENGVLEVSLAIPEPKAKSRKINVRSGGGQSEGGPRSVH